MDTAADGQSALERFASGKYGLVFTDLNMPVMNGFELAEAIRRLEADVGLSRTPIVALSAKVLPGGGEVRGIRDGRCPRQAGERG